MSILSKHMRLLTGLFFLFSLCVFTSCDSDSDENLVGSWTPKANFGGVARTGAVSFTIDGSAYVGTGSDGGHVLNDIWQYDAAQDTWTQKADFPGAARSGAVSFAANGRGYIGGGYNGTENLKDFWEYDPGSDTWTQIADFPGTARFGAVAMSLENKGYIGGGYDGAYLKDFWQYDPATGAWTEKASFSGARRVNGYAFAINGKGYVGGGFNNGILEADIMEYSPASDSWRNLKGLSALERQGTAGQDFPVPRTNAVAFVQNNRAYIAGGSVSTTPSNATPLADVWEFDPATDTWRLVTGGVLAAQRESAVAFAIGNYGYIGLGRNGATRFSDLWQFDATRQND